MIQEKRGIFSNQSTINTKGIREVEMTRRVKEIIEKHRGKTNQISAGEIGRMLGLRQEDTHVEARQLIFETIEKYKIPIAAGSKGYYLINNEEELNSYVRTLENRAKKILQRKETIKNFFKEYYK